MNVGVIVARKIATGDGTKIVCGNSDYIVNFTFLEQPTALMWKEYQTSRRQSLWVGEHISKPEGTLKHVSKPYISIPRH